MIITTDNLCHEEIINIFALMYELLSIFFPLTLRSLLVLKI